MLALTPYEFLVKRVRAGEIDPEDVDLEVLIEEFREEAKRLESSECLRSAGRFLSAVVLLLKFKVLKFFPPEERKEKERRPKVKLSEVLEVLQEQDEDLEWLYDYRVKVGRPQGRKDAVQRQTYKAEPIPLHKAFVMEDYAKVLREKQIEDFEKLKAFLYGLKDRVERIRFFLAWLSLE